MKKKALRIIGVLAIIAVVGTIVLFSMDWGSRTSTIDKSDVLEATDSIDSTCTVIPSLDDLEGLYIADTKKDKAELLFTVDGLKNTKGAFESFSVEFDIADDYTTSNLEVSIVSTSINTNNKLRDRHLRGNGFFEVEDHPFILFKANKIEFVDGAYLAHGDLTLVGTTKPLTINFNHIGKVKDAEGEIQAFEGKFSFDRVKHGMEEDSSVGDIVSITFYVELVKN